MVFMRKDISKKRRFLLEVTARFCFLLQRAISDCCKLLLMATLRVNEAVSNQKALLTSLVRLVGKILYYTTYRDSCIGEGVTSVN